jgi:hypothetical protein
VQQLLVYTDTTVIPNPSFSPDLAPCDVFLFPKMKLKLKGRRFDSMKEIQTVLQSVMKTVKRNDFQKCFRSWTSRWNHCINNEGNELEGDGVG